MNKGTLFVVSAPSGAGKTSLLKAMMTNASGITLSVSHTTRTPRPGEENGVHYHFVDVPAFMRMVENAEFLEHAKVFDNYYGTSEAGVRDQLNSGTDVVLEIDWQGAQQVRKRFPDAVTVFIVPPSVEALRERLSSRQQDSDEVIERRMRDALDEMSHHQEYDYIVVNDVFETALADIEAIIRSHALLADRQANRVPY